MKIGVIPDLHGKSIWKEFVNNNSQIEKWIMLGDYCDDFPPTTDKQIIDNLLDVIQFKKDNPNKVELLYGNHELSYAFGSSCSGYRASMAATLFAILNSNKDLFKFAYQIKNYIWVHAGITKFWYDDDFKKILIEFDTRGNLFALPIAEQINAMINSSKGYDAVSRIGRARGGFSYFGGPLWADKSEFYEKTILRGYHQIVGHSKIKDIKTNIYDDNTSITFCDVLDTQTKFYELEI
jgi:hypothetical protein